MKKKIDKIKPNKDDERLDALNDELGSFGLEPPKIYRKTTAENPDQEYVPVHSKPKPQQKKKSKLKSKNANQNPKALTKEEKNAIHKKKRRLKKKFRKLFTFLGIALGLIILVIVLSLTVIFNIDTIKVEGNKHYTNQQVLAVLPIEKEDNLFLIKKKSANEKLCRSLPYVYDAKISRKLPSTVVVSITEPSTIYYVKNSDNTYLYMDNRFKVLELNAKTPPKDGIEIKKVGLKNKKLGQTAKVSKEAVNKDLLELMKAVDDLMLIEATAIYSENRSNNFIVYENRITIKLGDTANLDDKLYSALAVIEKLNDTNPEAEGTLTSTGGKSIYFTEKK